MELDCAILTHPDDCAAMRAKIQQLIAGEIPTFVIEKRYFKKDGRTIWVQNSVSLTRDVKGQPVNIIALCEDISARKQAEDQLASELAATRRLQEISAELVHEGNLDGLYQNILDVAVAMMRSDFGSMQMLFPERCDGQGELLLLAHRGFTEEGVSHWKWVRADSNCICGEALRTGKRVAVPDFESCEFMAGTEDIKAYRQVGIRAAQSTLLRSRNGELLGMISTHWRQPHRPDERDLRLFDVLARQAADLIERRQADEKLWRSEQEIKRARDYAEATFAIFAGAAACARK